MTVHTKLKKDATEAVGRKLNVMLADLHLVYGHLHALHWNVEGHQFFTLHRELQSMYEGVQELIDETAERILMLGNRPATTFKEYLEISSLDELASRKYTADETADLVLGDLDHMVTSMRELIETASAQKDEGTADFAIQTLRDFEKQRWFWSAFRG